MIITAPSTPTHDIGSARFTSLATPSRGSCETSGWQVELDPATPATMHSLTRAEVFVVQHGVATVSIDGTVGSAAVGDAIVVPPGVLFGLANEGAVPVRLLCCLPVGGQAKGEDGSVFTPPWAV